MLYLPTMKALSDLLIEEKELIRHIRAKEKRLEKVRGLIARATPGQLDEAKAVEIIKAILKQGGLVYGDLHHQAYLHNIAGSYLKRLLKKYKGKYWENKRVGNKWFWGVSGSNI